MNAHPQQLQHDTLAQREEAAQRTPFDRIHDFVQLVAVCVLATGVGAFCLGAMYGYLQRKV